VGERLHLDRLRTLERGLGLRVLFGMFFDFEEREQVGTQKSQNLSSKCLNCSQYPVLKIALKASLKGLLLELTKPLE
jgi:hypothetical protein